MAHRSLCLAVAGSGKTTYLVKRALTTNSRVLILTFTLANEAKLKDKFYEIAGTVPANVVIDTWFAFLLKHGVRPFQGSFNAKLFDYKIDGLILVNEKSGFRFMNFAGKPVYYSEETNFVEHYFTKTRSIYSDKISKFVAKADLKLGGAIFKRLSNIFESVFIDEIQDLAGYDLEIIKRLLKTEMGFLGVGDPRQVTYHTHNESKHSKYVAGKIQQFLGDHCASLNVAIDSTSLKRSHRNNPQACEVSSALFPELPASESCECGDCLLKRVSDHSGVFVVPPKYAEEYIRQYSPVQLRDNRRSKTLSSTLKTWNFGECKGLEFDRVLVYPTKPMNQWIADPSTVLADATRAKLYVALTRARLSTAIISDVHPAHKLVRYPSI